MLTRTMRLIDLNSSSYTSTSQDQKSNFTHKLGYHTVTMFTSVVFAILSSIYVARSAAQFPGCGDIATCPSYNILSAQCELDDRTATSIGISKVNTSLTSQPLTWTVAMSRSAISDNDGDFLLKDFYLGQPPSVQLQELRSDAGCAIFFEGISSSLRFHDVALNDLLVDNGSCEDALTSQCVSEWTRQANDEVSKAMLAGGILDCGALASTLQNSPPSQCASRSGHWGTVSAQGK